MRLSRETRYAVLALVELAGQPGDRIVEARRLAAATDLPSAYLAKILQELARAGIVRSFRGRGYQLARPAEDIVLREIVVALEGPDAFVDGCIFWREECSDTNPCPLHWRWRELRPAIEDELGGVSVDQIRLANA